MSKTEKLEYELNGELGNFVDDESNLSVEEGENYLSLYSSERTVSCRSKWRDVPRQPSDFSDCKTPVSSCKDSDYEAWLANYYEELRAQEIGPAFFVKETDTSEFEEVTVLKKSSVLSRFSSPGPQGSTKYWGIKETRRHWPLATGIKIIELFPSIYPMLNVSTRYGRYLSILNTAAAVPEIELKKRRCSAFKSNLLRAKIYSYQLAKVVLDDYLIKLSWFDFVTKKVVITTFCQFLRCQRHLEKVSFENAQLQQLEGIVLLCALSRNAGEIVKELHMWNMFAWGQCPVLRDSKSLKALSKSHRLWDVDLTYHFLEILYNFSNLTHLSINYAYLANREGDALLRLNAISAGNLKELRLLCLPAERPFCADPGFGVGGYQIPDGVWKRARELNPKMEVLFAFINMPEYENIILFLSKNIPMSTFYVASGPELTFRTPWEIDTTLLELRNWYSSTLHTLCLHLWHHRDLLDYVIEYRILDEFPNLLIFEFIGVLKCLTTLQGFCQRLLTERYKLRQFLFWIQEDYSDKKMRKKTNDKVAEIIEKYLRKLQNIGIEAQIKTHPI